MKKCAVIGFGPEGKLLLNAAKRARVEVVAICDINKKAFTATPGKESWEKAYAHYRPSSTLRKTYTDWHQCLDENPEMDMVAVATWTRDHAKVAVKAAEMGAKTILCETPIAASIDEAWRIISSCKENKTILSVHHARRWLPSHQKIKQIIGDGEIGEIKHVWVSCGGARLGDLGTHWIDWALWLVHSNVISVCAHLGEAKGPNPRGKQFTDRPGDVFIRFNNGATALINEANAAVSARYEVVGTRGRILGEQIGDYETWTIDFRPEDHELDPIKDYYGKFSRRRFARRMPWKTLGVEAIKELLAGKNQTCDGYAGGRTLEVLIAAHLSGGKPVKVPIKGTDDFGFTLKIA